MIAGREPYRFTVEKYERLIDAGILKPEHKVELIRGAIVEKSARGDPHLVTGRRVNFLFVERFAGRTLPGVQDPVRLADSEPEPDFMLLKPCADYYASGKPVPADVLLLIEVSDSSLDYDRSVKLPLYAENGIVEYWIADVINRRLEVYRNPQPDGTYASTQVLQPGDRIDLVAFPGEFIDVADLF